MKSEYEDVKLRAKKRINIIKGQLDGLQKMIEDDKYCVDLLNQSLAIQNSLKSLDGVLFKRHLMEHVPHQMAREQQRTVGELVDLFNRVNR